MLGYGPNVTLLSSLLHLFHILFPLPLITMIVDNINKYAEQVLSGEAYKKFQLVTTSEFQAYLDFMILMGINKLPSLYDYWKTDSTCFSPIPNILHVRGFLKWQGFYTLLTTLQAPLIGQTHIVKSILSF